MDAPRTLELPNGLTVDALSRKEAMFLYQEIFVDRAYATELGDAPTVIDAGANIGMFTLFAHTEWPGVRVFAAEPIPQLNAILRRNVERHHITATLLCSGLSDAIGSAEFRYYPEATVLSGAEDCAVEAASLFRDVCTGPAAERFASILGNGPESPLERLSSRLGYERLTLPITRLSEVITQYELDSVDLLKVDVEGHELPVLRGLDDAHWPRIKRFVVEADDRYLSEIIALLRSKDYATSVRQTPFFTGTKVSMIDAVRKAGSFG
jgi:FkbM family methyltransferase